MGAKTDWLDGDIPNATVLNLLGTEINNRRISAAATLTGDGTSGAFWRSQVAGTYNNNNNSLTNCPSSYGFIILERLSTSEFSLTYYQQSAGPIWRTSGNASTVTCVWRKIWDDTLLDIVTGTCTLNSTTWVSVSYGRTLAAAPKVVLTAVSETAGVLAAKLKNITTTGFEALVGGSDLTGIVFNYIAIKT